MTSILADAYNDIGFFLCLCGDPDCRFNQRFKLALAEPVAPEAPAEPVETAVEVPEEEVLAAWEEALDYLAKSITRFADGVYQLNGSDEITKVFAQAAILDFITDWKGYCKPSSLVREGL